MVWSDGTEAKNLLRTNRTPTRSWTTAAPTEPGGTKDQVNESSPVPSAGSSPYESAFDRYWHPRRTRGWYAGEPQYLVIGHSE